MQLKLNDVTIGITTQQNEYLQDVQGVSVAYKVQSAHSSNKEAALSSLINRIEHDLQVLKDELNIYKDQKKEVCS